jgi:hypothetical protein
VGRWEYGADRAAEILLIIIIMLQSTVLTTGFPQIEQFLEVTAFWGERRAVAQPDSFPGAEQVFKGRVLLDLEAVRFEDC